MRRILMRAPGWRRGQLLVVVLVSASPALAGPGQADAVSSAPPDGPAARLVVDVTWADIVRLVDQHPRLAAARFQIDASRGGVGAAGAVPNPTLEASIGKGSARTGGASRVERGLALSMPLGWIAPRGSRIEAAEAELDVAVAEAQALRRDVMLQLRTLFWTLAAEQSRVTSLAALEAQTLALVRTVRKRVENGEARPVESTRVEIELETVTSELETARTLLSARQAELGLWLGIPAGKTLLAVADLELLPVAIHRDAAVVKVRTTHPALTLARARTRFLEAEVGAERMARVPAFGLTGFTTDELDRRAYGVGLAVDLPLWNWSSGRIAQAEAKLAAGRKQAEATGLEIEATVLDVHAACQASVLAATRFRNNVVPRSETAAATVEKTYQLGEGSLLEVIDARRTLLDSHRLYLGALTRAHIDCSRLGALVGEEPE
ncbi:MAG: TolC family protein [Deltaproteobacteria bacterium]|nr:TolC family protein [Deltaproteobacteria bacterium]